MAKNDILSIFHFFVLLTSGKNAKIQYTCAHFFLFYIFIFIQNQKKQKLKFIPLNFLFFHF